MKKGQNYKKRSRLGLLSKVQNPDDLEVEELISDKAKGSHEQLIKEESPDDLEVETDGKRDK